MQKRDLDGAFLLIKITFYSKQIFTCCDGHIHVDSLSFQPPSYPLRYVTVTNVKNNIHDSGPWNNSVRLVKGFLHKGQSVSSAPKLYSLSKHCTHMFISPQGPHTTSLRFSLQITQAKSNQSVNTKNSMWVFIELLLQIRIWVCDGRTYTVCSTWIWRINRDTNNTHGGRSIWRRSGCGRSSSESGESSIAWRYRSGRCRSISKFESFLGVHSRSAGSRYFTSETKCTRTGCCHTSTYHRGIDYTASLRWWFQDRWREAGRNKRALLVLVSSNAESRWCCYTGARCNRAQRIIATNVVSQQSHQTSTLASVC